MEKFVFVPGKVLVTLFPAKYMVEADILAFMAVKIYHNSLPVPRG